MTATIFNGDCLEQLQVFDDNYFDSVVTDPPYGLKFMGKDWDHGVPGTHFWKEFLRVCKPGAHLLAFGGTRTHHRLMVAIEDAGWEIRDTLMWVYGSGFPKSLDVYKTTHNKQWSGWGTALKPAWEPIILARKPLDGTVAQNVLKWGCGGINVDWCRIELNGDYKSKANGRPSLTGLGDNYNSSVANKPDTIGRFPANLIHDGSDEVLALFPQSNGQLAKVGPENGNKDSVNTYGNYGPRQDSIPRNDSGSAARFFYCAKASKSERNLGCENLPLKSAGECTDRQDGTAGLNCPRAGAGRTSGSRNTHPTVKPLALMKYLCRLITPPKGLILDPFAGSGSTGVAATREGFSSILIEIEKESADIARARNSIL